jgi:hypothetical protein
MNKEIALANTKAPLADLGLATLGNSKTKELSKLTIPARPLG